jgi:hypothetical protein
MTHSVDNAKKYPRLKIELGIKDIQTLYLIRRRLGIGKIYINNRKDRTPCVQYIITKRDHILYIINILQGKILLKNKQITYINWVTHYNTCYQTDIVPRCIDYNNNLENSLDEIKTILKTTSWLSGLIDAEGCFNIRNRATLKERTEGQGKLVSWIRPEALAKEDSFQHRFFLGNKNEFKFYEILSEIYFQSKKVYIRSNGVTLIEIVQTVKENLRLSNFTTLINYLKDHPLKSRQRLAYSYWLKSYNLLLSGRYKTSKRGYTRLVNCVNSLKSINSKLSLKISLNRSF